MWNKFLKDPKWLEFHLKFEPSRVFSQGYKETEPNVVKKIMKVNFYARSPSIPLDLRLSLAPTLVHRPQPWPSILKTLQPNLATRELSKDLDRRDITSEIEITFNSDRIRVYIES